MGKNVTANSVTSWVPSVFKQKDLEKAQANGLISADDQVTFPSTERIPKPPSSFRVMFFDFLLHGLSLPAHEFFVGFFSSMVCSFTSSHQTRLSTLPVLSPSVNHFWGSNPTFFSRNSSFGSAPALLYQRSLNWAELLSLFVLNHST
jgi:hypothetical protein